MKNLSAQATQFEKTLDAKTKSQNNHIKNATQNFEKELQSEMEERLKKLENDVMKDYSKVEDDMKDFIEEVICFHSDPYNLKLFILCKKAGSKNKSYLGIDIFSSAKHRCHVDIQSILVVSLVILT